MLKLFRHLPILWRVLEVRRKEERGKRIPDSQSANYLAVETIILPQARGTEAESRGNLVGKKSSYPHFYHEVMKSAGQIDKMYFDDCRIRDCRYNSTHSRLGVLIRSNWAAS